MLYEQRDLPIFQNKMYDSINDAISSPRGDMCLVEDLDTGLVRNAAFKPELMIYDRSYQNEQAVSRSFQEHLDNVAKIILNTMGRSELVEVGCGKAFFLEKLLSDGVEITGFDPAYEGANPRVRREYFQPGSGIEAKGLILRHVLEHIPDPVAFLDQLKQANGNQGKIYIEVPCFDWICQRRAWFDIFYEHVNYFRLSDFHRIFGNVISSGRIFGGQYLFVVAELSSLRQPVIDETDRADLPDDFTRKLDGLDKSNHEPALIWGGASKGVIFSLLRTRAGLPVKAVIDINPAKQGKYLPITGLQVVAPQDVLPDLPAGSNIYVMNRNYLDEIKQMSNNAYTYIEVDHD
ncbi:class I SAM-dependent methyltransferase [Sinorhizobium numidicum]|uniref:Class I SAM-dependent methyltransferase n=1 Tax=Sinorhizobium numidicum TaxID=680248 RepID=A0ABY8CXD9_9HYPH|nr:class I SAM-dependent methyltransferase [Sinorhizobium numidicum]WEX76634.1 class I SAM-dependent methyltransferase [Sinorhizobium numidicum]WEX83295.1 class I SAM-dependent methyltransferase [Sinorhizobium numidicum]